jgi:oligopeptide transport system substrate-binding protein
MKLGLTYHSAFDYERSRQAYEEGFALGRLVTSPADSKALPQAANPLRFNFSVVLTLDPALHNYDETAVVQRQLFSGLVTLTPEMDVIPDVAQSWQIQDDGRTYIFHLRDDVRWTDGQLVTAADFAYAWRRALDPEISAEEVAPILFDIVGAVAYHNGEGDKLGIQVVDDRTLRVELDKPTGYFLQLLYSHAMFPVPRHIVERYGVAWAEPDNFVGNGPFQLVSWEERRPLILERYPDHHRRYAGNVERIEILISTDSELCQMLYEANELDILNFHWFSSKEKSAAARKHASEYLTWPELTTIYLKFDTSKPPFDSRQVRQALALAIDKQRLAAVNCLGQVTPASGGLVPPGMPGHVPDLAPAYDLEAARRLLAEAGYPGGQDFPRTTVLVDTFWSTFLDPVLEQWALNLGIEMDRDFIKRYWDWSGGPIPHIIGGGWRLDYPDPDNFLRAGMSSNFTPELVLKWQDGEYDDLLERARRLMDQRERMALYRQAEQILVREAPIIPLIYNRSHFLVRPWITNFRQSGEHFFQDIIIEPH